MALEQKTKRVKPVRVGFTAARYNEAVMRQLRRGLDEDPEVDILTLFDTNYSSSLARHKAKAQAKNQRKSNEDPIGKGSLSF
jgi:hypothetical protein